MFFNAFTEMAAELGLFPPHGLNWQREFGQLFEARAPQSSQGKPYDAFRLFNPQYDIDRALKGANIGVEKMVVSSLATAEASLLKDEKEYGVCLVDIGAGTTNVAVYVDGRLALTHTFQRGGEHVTRDIAAVLQTTTEEAERLK